LRPIPADWSLPINQSRSRLAACGTDGQATPIAGFKTEAMCAQIRDGYDRKGEQRCEVQV